MKGWRYGKQSRSLKGHGFSKKSSLMEYWLSPSKNPDHDPGAGWRYMGFLLLFCSHFEFCFKNRLLKKDPVNSAHQSRNGWDRFQIDHHPDRLFTAGETPEQIRNNLCRGKRIVQREYFWKFLPKVFSVRHRVATTAITGLFLCRFLREVLESSKVWLKYPRHQLRGECSLWKGLILIITLRR